MLLALLLLAVLLGAPGSAEAKRKKPPPLPPSPADLPEHINWLAIQLNKVLLEDSGAITGQIQKLVVDHLQVWMAAQTPTDVELRRELEKAFSQLHYPFVGDPAVFAAPWKGGVILGAGYTFSWTDQNRVNTLAIFESQNGKSHLAAVTNFVPRTDLHYEIVPAVGSDDFWFFTYGFSAGKSQPRLSAVLYAFDGRSLKTLWETHDVYDGKIDFAKDKVTIRYLKEDEYILEQAHRRKPPRHETQYRYTAKGLEVESVREIPF